MKEYNIIISLSLALVIFIAGCLRKMDRNSEMHRNLDVKDLLALSLENVGDFWKDDKPRLTTDYMGATFEDYPGFLGGKRFGGKKKSIRVSVFESRETAIKAMEKRRNNVASIIIPGAKHKFFAGKWWYTDGIPNAVFVNQGNAIIEVSCYHPKYKEVKDTLVTAASEVASRIEAVTSKDK